MPSGLQGFLAALLVVAIIAACFGAGFLYANECLFTYQRAENAMPADGHVEMRYMEGGYARFTWTEGEHADGYLLKFLVTGSDGSPRVIYTELVEENVYYLPDLPLPEDLHIEIYSYNYYRFPYQDFRRRRYSDNCLRISGTFGMPHIGGLAWTADPDADTVNVRFEMDHGTTARMYYVEEDGSLTPVADLDRGNVTLQFGEGADFSIPAFGEERTFVFDAVSREAGFTYYGPVCASFTVVREDLLGTTLYLNCVDEGHNAFTLTWNETKGEHYEVQRYDEAADTWITVHTVPRDGERTYYTGHLDRYSTFRYRVVALGGQTLPDSEFAAIPAEVQVETGASLIYSTVWNIVDLDVYADAQMSQVIGKTAQGSAHCILDEENGMFRVRYQDGYGYIDSRYCMINLPEFIGGLCLYDITNSYDSLYKVHEFEIPEVTGQVVTGYEHVELAEDEYLVPLLYPTALKLEKAAFAAMEEGYKLRIYDAYRPREATLDLYETARTLMDDPVADEIYADYETRQTLIWYGREDTLLWYNFLQEALEIPQELIDAAGAETETEDEEPLKDAQGKTLEDYRPTYQELMTDNGRYYLSNFLANGGSRHNQGVAMDMTLVNMAYGNEMEMQTAMHDLSWFSEVSENNYAAKTLRRIMLDHGFVGLRSEWWHFQDDESKEALDLPFMQNGISPECWMADDNGWRYRNADGTCYTDCTMEVGGVSYTFDAEGYVVEPETVFPNK